MCYLLSSHALLLFRHSLSACDSSSIIMQPSQGSYQMQHKQIDEMQILHLIHINQ